MPSPSLPPPFAVDFIDARTKQVAEPWKAFFLRAANEIAGGVAPSDAPFVTVTANGLLTNAFNLGLLATGYLRLTTVAGTATPSTVTSIPTSDLTGTFPAASLSGQVSVPHGGTGDATLTNHAVLLGQAAAAVAFAAPGVVGTLLASNGASADPTFQNPPWIVAPASSVLAVTANAIAPTSRVHHCGAGLIKTITVPATLTGPDTLHLIPDAAFTYDATGNIGAVIGGLAVVGRVMDFTWDGNRWWASY